MFLCQQYSSGSGPFSQTSPLPLPPSLVVVLVVVVAVVVVALFVVVKARVVVVLVRLVVIFFVVLIVAVGQEVVLQRLRLCLLRRTHLRPPFCALFLTLLVEVWRPPPQVFVHDAHLPHCPHWQSTEREKHVLLSLFYFEPS